MYYFEQSAENFLLKIKGFSETIRQLFIYIFKFYIDKDIVQIYI
jgi:hypothetical protein